MVNGAPGSAWASLRTTQSLSAAQITVLGSPGDHDPTPLTAKHLFDLASLTKVFTTVAALRLVDAGTVALDAPVQPTMQVGAGPGCERITLRHLLTHTAGLPAEGAAWRDGATGEELRTTTIQSALTATPGTTHRYSDVGFIAVGELLERASGRALTDLVSDAALLMGASSLTWTPSPLIAVATEFQPHRGMVQGEVHDELAHSLGRPAGHAGLFGTVIDVGALAQTIRDEGVGPNGRVLSPESARLMTTPATVAEIGYGQAVGLRVRDSAWMGDLPGVGHTGFTGTCFAINLDTGGFGVLLTNRVHPSREGAEIAEIRRDFLRPLL